MLRLSFILLFVLVSKPCFSFGAKGHQAIAQIAQQHLNPDAKTAVLALLEGETITAVSTWPDRMCSSKNNPVFWSYDYAANWHFVNIAANKKNYQSSSKNSKGDAYVALLAFIDILQDKAISSPPIQEGLNVYFENLHSPEISHRQKQLALKFLIHLVADLHQPLHVGYLEDRGGNNIKVKWFNKSTNLHSVWDSRLIEAKALSSRQLSKQLEAQINAMPVSQLAAVMSQAPEQWLEEALDLRTEIYDIAPYQAHSTQAYIQHFTPVIERQLIKAGLRLAYLLNSLFSENNISSSIPKAPL